MMQARPIEQEDSEEDHYSGEIYEDPIVQQQEENIEDQMDAKNEELDNPSHEKSDIIQQEVQPYDNKGQKEDRQAQDH